MSGMTVSLYCNLAKAFLKLSLRVIRYLNVTVVKNASLLISKSVTHSYLHFLLSFRFVYRITARINKLCYGLDSNHVDPIEITKKVVQGVHQGITTVELDNLAAETAAYLTVKVSIVNSKS